MVRALMCFLTACAIAGNSSMTRRVAMAPIPTPVARRTVDNGRMIFRTATVQKIGPMDLLSRGNSRQGRSMVGAASCGATAASTRANLSATTCMVRVPTRGVMGGCSPANGPVITWGRLGPCNGLTAACTRGTLSRVRSMAKARTGGPMAALTEGSGARASSMALALLAQAKALNAEASGRTASSYDGWIQHRPAQGACSSTRRMKQLSLMTGRRLAAQLSTWPYSPAMWHLRRLKCLVKC
mmetsp:Transcript_1584/g.3277  ORF Transcript_1584/g.3277 Transcript_1584/m.3277 type:complete len:241 (+) Transcript_1584:259-981(+)